MLALHRSGRLKRPISYRTHKSLTPISLINLSETEIEKFERASSFHLALFGILVVNKFILQKYRLGVFPKPNEVVYYSLLDNL